MAEAADKEQEEAADFEAAFNEIADKKDGVKTAEEAVDALDEEPGEQASDDDNPPQDQPEPDPYEGMSEEVKARFLQLEEERNELKHKLDSNTGRVSAFQRKVNALEQQIEELRQNSSKPQPTDEEIKDAMQGTDEDWETFKTDYPEVAAAIDRRLDAAFEQQNKKIEAVETVVTPVVEKLEEDTLSEAVDEVAKVYPKWQDAVREEIYDEWISQQPPGIQALAASDDVRDATTLIGLFDEYRVAQGHPSLKTDPDSDKGGVDTGNELEERRKRQLKDGVSIPSESARVGTEHKTVDDFERAFEFYAQKREAQRQRA